MSDPSTPNHTASGASEGGASAPAERASSVAARLAAHPKVKQAVALAKEHPLGAVAAAAAAVALIEVEFAVGLLTGIGATALLARKTGPEARDQVIARGKQALARARVALEKRKKALPSQPAASAEPASTSSTAE